MPPSSRSAPIPRRCCRRRACRSSSRIACAALFAAVAGLIVGLPALRLKGIYLAIATIAFNVIVEEIIARWTSLTGGNEGKHLKPVEIFGWKLESDAELLLPVPRPHGALLPRLREPAALAHGTRLRRDP